MIFFKNQYKESIDYFFKKTSPHGHEHLCPRTRVLLTEYFGHKCLEFRARLCNVSGNIPRRLKEAVRTSFASYQNVICIFRDASLASLNIVIAYSKNNFIKHRQQKTLGLFGILIKKSYLCSQLKRMPYE